MLLDAGTTTALSTEPKMHWHSLCSTGRHTTNAGTMLCPYWSSCTNQKSHRDQWGGGNTKKFTTSPYSLLSMGYRCAANHSSVAPIFKPLAGVPEPKWQDVWQGIICLWCRSAPVHSWLHKRWWLGPSLLWNFLPQNICTTPVLFAFCKDVKLVFFSPGSWIQLNCYISFVLIGTFWFWFPLFICVPL